MEQELTDEQRKQLSKETLDDFFQTRFEQEGILTNKDRKEKLTNKSGNKPLDDFFERKALEEGWNK